MTKKTAAPTPEDNERNELVAKIEGDMPYSKDAYVYQTKKLIAKLNALFDKVDAKLAAMEERYAKGKK